MILGHQESEILKLAVKYQSNMTDGCAVYWYDDGKMSGAGYTTGETEHPDNHVIEVYRLPQGEHGKIDMRCHDNGDCPYIDGFYNEEHKKLFPKTKEECCMDAFIEDGFTYDWERNFRDSVEEQVRDIISSHLNDTIDKLNDIRIAISDRLAPHNYINVRQDDWEMRVLDTYVDDALENGFTLPINPTDWLYGEIQNLANVQYETEDVEFWTTVAGKIEEYDFDGVLNLLK